MIVYYCLSLFRSARYFKAAKSINSFIKSQDDSIVEMAVILPCLREQNIISESIDYFCSMNLSHTHMHLIISCTKRELVSNEKYGFSISSAEVARNHISALGKLSNVDFFVYEAEDFNGGDRATQMNEAMDAFLSQGHKVDIVAVFDADSRPDKETFEEVAYRFKENPKCIYQQPENYLAFAESISKSKKSKIAVANALYQHVWTIINEIPMFERYSKKNDSFLYMNGHGMFFPLKQYLKLRFPEHEVTDGIHVGYRVWVSHSPLRPLLLQGYTEAPVEIKKLPQQHKRWFGGSIRLYYAIEWGKKRGTKPSFLSTVWGYWTQVRWCLTANVYLINFVLSMLSLLIYKEYAPLIFMLALLFSYSYLLSIISMSFSSNKYKISFWGFALIPFAVFAKSLGPDLFFIEKLFKRKIEYQKCER